MSVQMDTDYYVHCMELEYILDRHILTLVHIVHGYCMEQYKFRQNKFVQIHIEEHIQDQEDKFH